jgi:predicted cupin superfamily sugar epimerase
MKEAIDVIKQLDLKPLPEEGGYYRKPIAITQLNYLRSRMA